MEKLEVNINRQGSFMGGAFGETSGGKKVFVLNSDLLKETKAVVRITGERGEYLVGEIEETYEAMEAIAALLDKDDLVPAQHISMLDRGILGVKGKYLFPYDQVKGVIDYVADRPELWVVSRWALTTSRRVKAGAMRFGVTFERALKKIQECGLEKARLYCPHPEAFSDRGQTVGMFAMVGNDGEGNFVLEVWQGGEDVDCKQ